MSTNIEPPFFSPVHEQPNGQGTPPEQVPPPEQGTLPEHGSQPQLTGDSVSPQRERNEQGVPSYDTTHNAIDSNRVEAAREALDEALENGTLKPEARELLGDEGSQDLAAGLHNDLGTTADARDFAKDTEFAADINTWVNENGGLVIVGGYGESRKALKALARAMAAEFGIDTSRKAKKIKIITMLEGITNPEKLREAAHGAAVVGTHSAGWSVLRRAFGGPEGATWLRPGSIVGHNPPSAERPPRYLEGPGKKMSILQLLIGASIVGLDDAKAHGIGGEARWRPGWIKEVFRHPIKNIKALKMIADSGPGFAESAGSFAEKDSTEVIIEAASMDGFFGLSQDERDKLKARGVVVADVPYGVGPDGKLVGHHNAAVFEAGATMDATMAAANAQAMQDPDSSAARKRGGRDRIASLRQAQLATGGKAGEGAASDEASDRELVDANK